MTLRYFRLNFRSRLYWNWLEIYFFFVLAEIDEFSSTTYESIGDGTNNNNNASSSPESSDDFVLVPNNLPAVDAQAYERK